MARYGKAKPKPRRDQFVISSRGRKIFLTKSGALSVFQLGGTGVAGKTKKGSDNTNIEAIVEQISFIGIELRDKVAIPSNSVLWSKLSSKREEGKG